MNKKALLKRRWSGMRNRCLNKTSDDYRTYGAKGIGISSEWMDFENFFNDMEKGFEQSLVLDRIDPYGNYEKNNCQWITKVENSTRQRRKPTPRIPSPKVELRSRVTFWLHPEHIEKLKTLAGKKKLSVSDFTRKLIDKAK